MTLRIIDLETTGVDPAEHSIIEIASVDLRQDRTIGNHQSTLVNPHRDVPPESSAVHHLIGDDLVNAPDLADVLERFTGAGAYIAHNCDFERKYLAQHFGSAPWVCTYKVALRAWPDAPGHNLQTLRYWRGHARPFNIPRAQIDPHRALSDCIVTAAILDELLNEVGWTNMIRWSSEPPLLTYCRFGTKHKGKRYDAIAAEDPSYLTWIIEKSDLDADTKWNAAYWLERQKAAKAG